MQPPNIPYSSYSDQYTYNPQFQTPQSQSQFYSQNPNPNPNPYHHSQLHFTEPDPPGAQAYYPSYPNPNPNPYAAADVGVQNWEVDNLVQHYGGDTAGLYNGAGGTEPQDGSQHLVPAIPTHSNWPNQKSTAQPRGPWKKIPKKTKIAQSAWCEICKIECNTKDVLDQHKLGKKHQKMLVKLNSAALVASISATAHVNPVPSNPIIGPSENPKKGTCGSKKKAETAQELEMKRRKVLEGGAAASAVRTCSFCNVVCNSDTVFRYHLAGQKHASMLKKSQQAAVAEDPTNLISHTIRASPSVPTQNHTTDEPSSPALAQTAQQVDPDLQTSISL
ncbi:zinc finger RNA-binding protein [Tanacetum coccineum]|uniref:Zinc finger RNA-binding protein n=1 Tax=Tanacetum coccineum TaxID=301880 RepID=A0ABQ5EWC6_9ASTR